MVLSFYFLLKKRDRNIYLFCHTLYYVFHGMEFDIQNPVVMHEWMRTLSSKLMLILDDNHIEYNFTLLCLKGFMQNAAYNRPFDVAPKDLEVHMDREEKMGGIISFSVWLVLVAMAAFVHTSMTIVVSEPSMPVVEQLPPPTDTYKIVRISFL